MFAPPVMPCFASLTVLNAPDPMVWSSEYPKIDSQRPRDVGGMFTACPRTMPGDSCIVLQLGRRAQGSRAAAAQDGQGAAGIRFLGGTK